VTIADKERAELADLLDRVGPDAPTRCEGWTTQDLLVHLLIRERRPDAVPGTFLSIGSSWTHRVGDGYRSRPWHDLVGEFRSRPPWYLPTHWDPVDEAVNAGEYFIHHEDVRRGRPGWEPRHYDDETTAKLRAMVRGAYLRLALRKAGRGVVAVLPGGERVVLRRGEPEVEVTGEPGEIVIWASGRPAARVTLSGRDADVAALERAGFRVDPSLW
jgi:uncharacterized protein (TIGR03085 family)